MSTVHSPITPDQTLADLAATRAGASRVFHGHRLDFCCHGRVALGEAARKRGLDVAQLIRELEAADAREEAPGAATLPLAELVDVIESRFHASHRTELPRLSALAGKVESVHSAHPHRPRGLAAHLEEMTESLELHMQKEEQVLFPLLRNGVRGRQVAMPAQVLELEHGDHALALARMRELAHDFAAPAEACSSWRALYLGLAELERDLMEHIHLENNVLFPRAMRAQELP